MRLIDADRLNDEYWKIKGSCQLLDDTHYADAVMSGMRALMVAVDNMPTVEAEPVRHGVWKVLRKPGLFELAVVTCSECGYEFYAPPLAMRNEHYSYCCHCGARMDAIEETVDETD